MMMRCVAIMMLGMACAGDASDTDTDSLVVDTGRDTEAGCDEVTVYVDGREMPQVGDRWTVLLRCDGVTLTGPMVIQVEPLRLATVEENVLTFVEEGSGVVRAQVGSFRASREVIVAR